MFNNTTLLLILGSVVAAFAGWYLFLRDTTPAPLLTTQDLTVQGSSDKEVVETLLQLRTITLSGTILSDPAFLRLVDTGTQIMPEPVGRPNPFLPLGRSGTTTRAGTTTPETEGN